MAWEEWSQREDLTTRLRNILDEYPPGVGPFKEFLQNADDAKASRFTVVLDGRDFRGQRGLPTEASPDTTAKDRVSASSSSNPILNGLSDVQGPALLFHNDAVFTESDFKSVISLGSSAKLSDTNRIGKFGLGMNSAYHYTDVLSFVSADSLVVFDPHGKRLPNRVLGARAKLQSVWEQTPDMLTPYALSDLSESSKTFTQTLPKDWYSGTVFRLPLRESESDISQFCPTLDDVRAHLDAFIEQAAVSLLFLRHVTHIDIVEYTASGEYQSLFTAKVSNTTPELLKTRQTMGSDIRAGHHKTHLLEISVSSMGLRRPRPHRWMISVGRSIDDDSTQSLAKRSRAPSWAAAAAWAGDADAPEATTAGRVFCFLPLPIETGVPGLHVHAAFALTSNRRALWQVDEDGGTDESIEGSSAVKGKWNHYLLTKAVPQVWAHLVGSMSQLLDVETARMRDHRGRVLSLTPKLFRDHGIPSLTRLSVLNFMLIGRRLSHKRGNIDVDLPPPLPTEMWLNILSYLRPHDLIPAEWFYRFWPTKRVSVVRSVEVLEWLCHLPVFHCGWSHRHYTIEDIRVKPVRGRPCGPKLTALLQTGESNMIVMSLPDTILELVTKTTRHFQEVNVQEVCRVLQGDCSLDRETAHEVLEFVLHGQEPSQHDYRALNGLQVIPLTGDRLGVAHVTGQKQVKKKGGKGRLAGGEADRIEVYVTHSDPRLLCQALPGCAVVVDASKKVARKLTTPRCISLLNIEPISMKSIALLMPFCLPSSWEGKNVVQLDDDGVSAADVGNSTLNTSGNVDEKMLVGRATPAEARVLGETTVLRDNSEAERKAAEATDGFTTSTKSKNKRKKELAQKVRDQARMTKSSLLGADVLAQASTAVVSTSEACTRLCALWSIVDELARDSVAAHVEFLGDWPIVPLMNGHCVTLGWAQSRLVLHSSMFEAHERSVMRQFGCLFVRELGEHGSRCIESCLDMRRSDALQALAAATSLANYEVASLPQRQSLRTLILSWGGSNIINPSSHQLQDETVETADARPPSWASVAVADGDHADPTFCNSMMDKAIMATEKRMYLRRLPIFETLADSPQLVPFSHASVVVAPGDIDSTTHPQVNLETPTTWETTLVAAGYGTRLLSLQGPYNRRLLNLAKIGRPPVHEFLSAFSALLGDEYLSRDVSLRMIDACALLFASKSRRSDASRVVGALRKLNLLVNDAGVAFTCTAFADPDDKLLSQIRGLDMADTHQLEPVPPKIYQTPGRLRVLRECGLRNLNQPEVFLEAANRVAAAHSVETGKELTRFFALNFRAMGFSAVELNRLRQISFVPALDMTSMAMPLMAQVGVPGFSLPSEDSRQKKKKKGRGRGRDCDWRDLLDDETQGACDALNVYSSDDEALQQTPAQRIHNAKKMITANSPAGHGVSDQTRAVFKCIGDEDCCLAKNAFVCWAGCYVYPRGLDVENLMDFSIAPTLGLPLSPRGDHIINSLRRASLTWTKFGKGIPPDLVQQIKGVVIASLTLLEAGIQAKTISSRDAKSLLSTAEFVVYDNGAFASPSQICVELEEDIGADLMPLPLYLIDLSDVLLRLGATSTQSDRAPLIRVTDVPPHDTLFKRICTSLNNPVLADVRVTARDETTGKLGEILAHRLVLGMSSSIFATMFQSGFSEAAHSSNQSSIPTIKMPEWAGLTSTWALLRYLYTSDPAGGEIITFEPPTAESCDTVCQLLRLSDFYQLDHLKQWCEVYLGSSSVLSVYNVLSLLVHANVSNAVQLQRVCAYHARTMLGVVVKMEEWEHLPDNLKDMVTQK